MIVCLQGGPLAEVLGKCQLPHPQNGSHHWRFHDHCGRLPIQLWRVFGSLGRVFCAHRPDDYGNTILFTLLANTVGAKHSHSEPLSDPSTYGLLYHVMLSPHESLPNGSPFGTKAFHTAFLHRPLLKRRKLNAVQNSCSHYYMIKKQYFARLQGVGECDLTLQSNHLLTSCWKGLASCRCQSPLLWLA